MSHQGQQEIVARCQGDEMWLLDLGRKSSTRGKARSASHFRIRSSIITMATVTMQIWSATVFADEGGVSYWLPGRFGSLAATPQVPGWSMAEVYYHTSVSAFGSAAAAREIQVRRIPATVNVDLNLRLNAQGISSFSIPLTRSQRRCWADSLPLA